jgi:hypothetical protein
MIDNIKILISGGCSFTQYPRIGAVNWPFHLANHYNLKPYYKGNGAAGNALIANKVLHTLHQCLFKDKIDPSEILVGIMWSGFNRHVIYLNEEPINYFHWYNENDELHEGGNPNKIAGPRNYYMIHNRWKDKLSENYYKNFHSYQGSLIDSIKNYLLIQNFCKCNDIQYFFTEYSSDTVTNSGMLEEPDIKYLYEMIDTSKFLPVPHMRYWNDNHSNLKYEIKDDFHPTGAMSEKFTNEVIIPFIETKLFL